MALASTAVPAYPNVPVASGVPPLLRSINQVQNTVAILASDVAIIGRLFTGSGWGLFTLSGEPVVVGDAVANVDYRREFRASDYPVEDGGFASFNKVAGPFEFRIGITCRGSPAERQAFLAASEAALGSLDLFSVVMPDAFYRYANVVSLNWRRSARNGVEMILVEFGIQEIRITMPGTLSATKDSTAVPAMESGSVQPVAPSTGQAAAAATKKDYVRTDVGSPTGTISATAFA